jgi:predicted DNA-binding transcriptional regulator AlpA
MDPVASGRRWLPDSQVCKRYGVSPMTLWRWDHNPEMNFPKPMRINRRKYRDEAELEAWERSR